MAKPPPARGFTLAEKRALLFEQVSLYAVFLVALIAAVISFVALSAVGKQAGLGAASHLLPVAIDGFGIACSVGIVRSVASGEPMRERISEWFGLIAALALSILGNVHHSLDVGATELPDYVKIAYATAIPMIVAYGIHVYGRAMSRGISAHVMADDPDQLRFDVAHLGDDRTVARAAAPARMTRAPRAVQAPEPARTTEAPRTEATRAPRAASTVGTDQARMRAAFDEAVRADPLTKPDAAALHRELGLDCDKATSRRWVQRWWTEHEASMGMTRPEPISEEIQASEDKVEESVAS